MIECHSKPTRRMALQIANCKLQIDHWKHWLSLICNLQFALCILQFVFVCTPTLHADDLPRVTVFDADGRTSAGLLRAITSDSLSVDADSVRSWKWGDVVSVQFEGHTNAKDRTHAVEPRGAALWLANGDRLVAKATAIEDEQLKAHWMRFGDWPTLSLPLESVRGLTLSLPRAHERRDEITAWLIDRRQARDELRLFNGDVIAGELKEWSDGKLTLTAGAENVTLSSGDVREIGFNSELLTLPPTTEVCWLVSLVDGSRVTLRVSQSRLEGTVLKATHVTGVHWDLPLEAVSELRVLRGRAVFLSDLTPVEMRHTPFLANAREWPLQRDLCVTGRPLRLGGREFPKGVGLHSRSVATYELDGKYRGFYAVIGLDDTTTQAGNVTCAVEVDGRRVFEVKSLTRTRGPQRLPEIDLSGAKRMTLIVDFGELGDAQDQVDWCDAVLLR